MKAGNGNRVVLLANDGRPRGVALGDDGQAEHVGACPGLRDWLGIPNDAGSVGEACCRPKAPGPDAVLHPEASLPMVAHTARIAAQVPLEGFAGASEVAPSATHAPIAPEVPEAERHSVETDATRS